MVWAMIRFALAAISALLLGLALRVPALATDSASASFRNSRSSVDAGGGRKFSASFRGDASLGAVSVPSAVSAGFANRDGFMGIAFQPARITDLVAGSSCGATSVLLRWTAPGNDGDESTTAGAFIIKYSSTASESPALSDANFNAATTVVGPPSPALRGTTHTVSVNGLTVGTPYYFAIKAAERDGMRSVNSAGAASLNGLIGRLAQTPYGIGLSSAASAATVTWLPVIRYDDFSSFVDPNAPAATELSGYRVYRSTTPTLATWTEVANVSTATLTWTDAASGPQYYYSVRAQTYDSCLATSRLSSRSLIRAAATFDAYSVSPDDQSYFHIPRALVAPMVGSAGNPASAYAIVPSSNPAELGGRVYKAVGYQAYRGGLTPDSNFSLQGMGTMFLHYEVAGTSLTPSFAAGSSPENASVYWYNGDHWLQLYGKGDPISHNLFLETKYFGDYQIRSVERVTSFSFNLAGLSNKFVTPNGDGKNDTVVFTFDNPHDAKVTGRIVDLRGRVVASDLRPGPTSSTLQWDGSGVAGGVYIYQLEAEGHAFTGTIVVLK
jgi:hypothetical protein